MKFAVVDSHFRGELPEGTTPEDAPLPLKTVDAPDSDDVAPWYPEDQQFVYEPIRIALA